MMATIVNWAELTVAILIVFFVVGLALRFIGWCIGYGFWEAKQTVEEEDEEEDSNAQP